MLLTRQIQRWFSACPYRVLGVVQSASPEEIKQKFRDLAKQYHPDVNKAPDASSKMAEIAAAYEKLTDGSYTAGGKQEQGETGSSFSAFAEAFERMRRQSKATGAASRGSDVSATLELAFSDLFRLETKTLRVPRVRLICDQCTGSGCRPGTRPSRCNRCKGTGMVRLDRGIMSIGVPCEECGGKGEKIASPCGQCKGEGVKEQERTVQVKIPAGIRNFMEIRMAGLGHAGTGEFARNGDLYVTLKIKEDPKFKIMDDDVYVDVEVGLGKFFLGGEVDVALPEGGVGTVKLEAGTRVGSTKSLRGKGLMKAKGRGDLIVKLGLKVKEVGSMTKREIALIKELDELWG